MAAAEEFYNTSLGVCSYLVETFVVQAKLDHVRNMSQVAKAQMSAQKARALYECDTLERRDRGKPAEKRRCEKRSMGLAYSFLPFHTAYMATSSMQRNGVRIPASSSTWHLLRCNSTAVDVKQS